MTYLYFGESGNPLREQLPSAQRVTAVAPPSKYTPAKIARGLVSRHPLPVQNYTSPEMAAAIQWQLKSEPFDIVHLDSIHLAGYLPVIRTHAPNAKITLDWHNIESELMRRYATSVSGLRKTYAVLTAKRLESLESEMLKDCFGHLVCSEREQGQLCARVPEARIAVLENGVDTERFRPANGRPEQNRLVFVGQMSYHANADAAVWFVRAIWPAIKSAYPNLILTIVGSDPGPTVRALQQPGSIEVTGTVPDVVPYYQNAFASIVPLQTGGGTRLKILEAMAAGTPVISTSQGAEGLKVGSGHEFLLADATVQSWMRALDELQSPNRREEIASSARALVCREYDWKAIGAKLAELYLDWSKCG